MAVVELEIYLIRHGESKGNVRTNSDGLSVKDLADPPLTEKGKKQADALGKYLKDVSFDSVFSSGLVRAAETATALLNYKAEGTALEILPDLTEVGLGEDYPGASLEELRGINKNALMAKGIDNKGVTVAYSQSVGEDELFARAKRVVDYLRNRYTEGQRIAVVSHAAFITYIVFHLMGYKECPLFDINFFNTGITKIVLYKEGTNSYGDIVFDYLNNTEHLANLNE